MTSRPSVRTAAAALAATVLLAPHPLGAQQEEEAPPAPEASDAPRPPALAFRVQAGGSFLGVGIEDVDAGDVERLRLPEERGALVTRVMEDSPAARAGLREGDVVLRWNEEPVESVAELRRLVRETPPGRTVGIRVFRDGGRKRVEATLEEREEGAFFRGSIVPREMEEKVARRLERARTQMERAGRHLREERLEEHAQHLRDRLREVKHRLEDLDLEVHGFRVGSRRLGLRLQPLTDQLAAYFGVDEGRGVLVASVRKGSPAERAGVRAGDVLLSLAGEEVNGPSDAAAALMGAEEGEVEIVVFRDGERSTLTARLPERGDR